MAKDQGYRLLMIPHHLNISQRDIEKIAMLKETINFTEIERLLTDITLEQSKQKQLSAEQIDQLHVLIQLFREAE